MSRGFFAVGIEAGKTEANLGALWRSAHAFGAAFIFTAGARYPRRQATDTTCAWRHLPLFEHESVIELVSTLPRDTMLIGVDCGQGEPRSLSTYRHPERAVYLLGAEDHGLSQAALDMCDALIEIPTAYCLNVATAGALVMYDRSAKA